MYYYAWALVARYWGFALVPYALWRGGPAERWGAGIYAIGWALSFLLQDHTATDLGYAVMVIDMLCLVAFTILSAWSRKIWTLFAAAFMLVAVLYHIVARLGHVDVVTYVTGTTLWGGYAMLAALTAAMISVERDRWRARK